MAKTRMAGDDEVLLGLYGLSALTSPQRSAQEVR